MEYSVKVYWSEEDNCFLAEVPDLPGCIADGATEADARRYAQESAEHWIKMAQYLGRDIPKPSVPEPEELAVA